MDSTRLPPSRIGSRLGNNGSMSQEPFGDVPLFREIQKLLTSTSGPVNFEIARQVAKAVASQGAYGARAGAATKSLWDGVHPAELLLAGYTRLSVEEPARARIVDRSAWVDATLKGWRWLLERLAARFSAELGRLTSESGEPDESSPMSGALGPIASLLMGMQSGALVGHLARDALGRFDWAIPRDDDGILIFVEPNLAVVAADYSIDEVAWGRWLALHDAARHLVLFSQPWVTRYFRGLLTEVVDATEIDVADLQRRLMELQARGMESLQGDMGPETALPIVPTQRHAKALERWRAFVAAWEGYAAHSCEAVEGEAGGSEAPMIEEAMARRASGAGEGESMLKTILGISPDPILKSSGATFCAAIVSLKGIKALNRIWDAPDNLPTMPEIKDPFAWMERILGSD